MNMIEIDNELKSLIENNVLTLTTVDKEQSPHSIAVAYVKVVDNDKILVSDNYMKETIENLKINNNVSLLLWNENWKKNCFSFELKGKAQYFTSGKWREEVKKIQENRGNPAKGAVLVTILKIKKLA